MNANRAKRPALPVTVISLTISRCVGGIAQLGERLHGMQEVSGSIPLTSTNREEDIHFLVPIV